jgi:hypothetical protein
VPCFGSNGPCIEGILGIPFDWFIAIVVVSAIIIALWWFLWR